MTHFIAGAKGKLFEMGECANLVRNHWLLDGWEKDCHTRILQMQFPRNKKACSKIICIMLQALSDHCYFRQEKKETKTCLKDNLPLYGLNVIKDGPTIGSAVNVSLSLLPWIGCGFRALHYLYISVLQNPASESQGKKGKFAGHLSCVAKQPCGSVN